MKLYFTDKQVPEMSGLVRSQCSCVRRGALDLFCRDHPPARMWVCLGHGMAVLIGCAFALTISYQFWIQLLVGTVVISVIEIFFQSFLTERLRPYFRRYVEEHRDEISRAA
jgi:hypothetical protein